MCLPAAKMGSRLFSASGLFRDGGIVGGYRACLASCVGIDCSQCPADLEIIEQVVLARNRDRYPESITSVRVTHTEKDRQCFPRPFFMNEREAVLFEESDGSTLFMLLFSVRHRKLLGLFVSIRSCSRRGP